MFIWTLGGILAGLILIAKLIYDLTELYGLLKIRYPVLQTKQYGEIRVQANQPYQNSFRKQMTPGAWCRNTLVQGVTWLIAILSYGYYIPSLNDFISLFALTLIVAIIYGNVMFDIAPYLVGSATKLTSTDLTDHWNNYWHQLNRWPLLIYFVGDSLLMAIVIINLMSLLIV